MEHREEQKIFAVSFLLLNRTSSGMAADLTWVLYKRTSFFCRISHFICDELHIHCSVFISTLFVLINSSVLVLLILVILY